MKFQLKQGAEIFLEKASIAYKCSYFFPFTTNLLWYYEIISNKDRIKMKPPMKDQSFLEELFSWEKISIKSIDKLLKVNYVLIIWDLSPLTKIR